MADHDGALLESVRKAYSAAAENPQGKHAFPVGREFAESVGYPKELLDTLPASCAEAFAGVSNVSITADILEGSTVLDLGCGAGLDALIAARRTGPAGRVIGIDFSDAMLLRARQAASEAGLGNVEFRASSAAQVPVPDRSIDVALVNGIFNLNPDRGILFMELARIMRPGGALYASELILTGPLLTPVQRTEANWFAWICGAREGGAFLDEFRNAGFREAAIVRTFRNARTKNPAVIAVDVTARR